MRSLFIIRYRLKGGSLSARGIYAGNLAIALERFHKWMGGCGLERDRYSLTGHRQIPEPRIYLDVHGDFINRLTHGERVSFFQDRAIRQRAEVGYIQPNVYNQLQQLITQVPA